MEAPFDGLLAVFIINILNKRECSLHVVLRIMNKLYNQGRAGVPPVFIWKMNPLVIPVTSVKFRRHLYQFRETELVVARGVLWEIRKQRRETTGIYCVEKFCETVFLDLTPQEVFPSHDHLLSPRASREDDWGRVRHNYEKPIECTIITPLSLRSPD